MDTSILFANLLTAPILFFILGMVATWLRSDLEIPPAVARLLAIYLLFAIGLKGGVAFYGDGDETAGLHAHMIIVLLAAIVMAAVVPLTSFWILRWKLSIADAAAIAATYGSISAITFITAADFLNRIDVAYSGYMVAAMALMESPAIVVAVLLVRKLAPELDADQTPATRSHSRHSGGGWRGLLREAFFNGAVILLLGSLIIGAIIGPSGFETVRPLVSDLFTGILCLFLLDMGLSAVRRLRDLRRAGAFLIGFAILAPIAHAVVGILVARLLGLTVGDALLFAILCGSASYIAVPAAMRLSIPQANPSLYLPMSLAVTFPFNIIVGIPLYFFVINLLW